MSNSFHVQLDASRAQEKLRLGGMLSSVGLTAEQEILARARFHAVRDQLERARHGKAADFQDHARESLLAYTSFPLSTGIRSGAINRRGASIKNPPTH